MVAMAVHGGAAESRWSMNAEAAAVFVDVSPQFPHFTHQLGNAIRFLEAELSGILNDRFPLGLSGDDSQNR